MDRKSSAQCEIGYRCPGGPGGWVAQFIPELNQVWTNPTAHRSSVKAALPEEFIHVTSMNLRPAQLYPLTNYLAAQNQVPGVAEFRDLVETVYMISWPLVHDRPVVARSLPSVRSAEPKDTGLIRSHAKRVLRLARRYASASARDLDPDFARHQSLWALMMFLLHVVPARPDQCAAVLDLIESLDCPDRWESYPKLFEYFVTSSHQTISAAPIGRYQFLVAVPSEPHRNVAVMLDVVSTIAQADPEHLLPVFPTILNVTTLDSTGFVPLVWMKKQGQRIYAWVELWDQTKQKIASRRSVIAGRRALYDDASSPVTDCPVDRFHRDVVERVGRYIEQTRPTRPSHVLSVALDAVKKGLDRHLSRLGHEATTTCPWCRRLYGSKSSSDNAAKIRSSSADAIGLMCEQMNTYESWLLTSGLELARVKLHQAYGWESAIEPVPIVGHGKPILWRSLSS